MWKTINTWARNTPLYFGAVVGWAIPVLLTVGESSPEAKARMNKIWENRAEIFGSKWVVVFLLSFITIWFIVLLISGRKSVPNFDDLEQWSVSIDLGCPGISAKNSFLDRYILELCEFRNHSISQAREIEVRLEIPYLDGRPSLTLWASREDAMPSGYGRSVQRSRYSRALTFPITIEPNGHREGYIDFEIPNGIDPDQLDWVNPKAEVIERRAIRKLTLKPHHVFNAVSRSAYRGSLYKAYPIRRARVLTAVRLTVGRMRNFVGSLRGS